MGRDTHLPRRLLLGDERVDHAAVFAVDAADAALFLQLLQRPVHRLVADHHGRIGHIHLEGGDARGVHVVDLAGDVLVPVVDRHVEAVVAPGAPVGLLVPELQAVGERLALVGAGEIDDRGRSAVDGGETAAVKVVDGGRVRDVEVKVRVRVDKAGQKELARHVDGLRQRVGDAARDADDLLPVDEDIRALRPLAGDDGAALEELSHQDNLPYISQFNHSVYHKNPGFPDGFPAKRHIFLSVK